MSAGIVEGIDRGAVGFCEEFGGTWHGLKEYQQINGPVPFDTARDVLDYKVAKIPISLFIPEYLRNTMPEGTHGMIVPDMFALVREDNGKAVYDISVSNKYEIFQNIQFLDRIHDGLLSKNPQLGIESCGSLFAGRIAFLNILINKFAVKKDVSETVSRLMYTNAFGGRSLSACAHATRVVCANTHHISEAQGIANGTHRKARHTKNADKKVVEFLIELAALQKVLSSHKEALDHLVDMQMSKRDVDCFLGNMFPIAEDDSEKTGTTRENKQDEIKEIFETCEDLQGPIQGTRYAMFQSVTNYSQYKNVKRGTDRAGAWYDAAAFGGSRQKFNQKAFDLLMDDVIPECPTRLSVMA